MVAGIYGLNIVHMCWKIWVGNSFHLLKKKKIVYAIFFWVVTEKSRLLDE